MRAANDSQTDNRMMRNKLCSEQGASLALALLFFVLCAVVGSVILTAATSAMGRMSHAEDHRQAKYAVNAAARLLHQELTGKTFTAECLNLTSDAPNALNSSNWTFDLTGENADKSSGISELQFSMAKLLLTNQWNTIKSLNDNPVSAIRESSQANTSTITWEGNESTNGGTGTVTLQLNASDGVQNLPEVTAQITMDGHGNLTAELKTAENSASSATKEIRILAQPALVRFDAVTDENDNPVTRLSYSISW